MSVRFGEEGDRLCLWQHGQTYSIILEADPRVSLDAVCEQMGRTPPWAKELVLRADGYECAFYKKD